MEESIKEHESLKSDINNPEHKSCLKHRKQEVVTHNASPRFMFPTPLNLTPLLFKASLVGNITEAGWMQDGTVYVEFGAGRARLSTYLIELAGDQNDSVFILVDRYHARNKVRTDSNIIRLTINERQTIWNFQPALVL